MSTRLLAIAVLAAHAPPPPAGWKPKLSEPHPRKPMGADGWGFSDSLIRDVADGWLRDPGFELSGWVEDNLTGDQDQDGDRLLWFEETWKEFWSANGQHNERVAAATAVQWPAAWAAAVLAEAEAAADAGGVCDTGEGMVKIRSK